jgi:pectinesterase
LQWSFNYVSGPTAPPTTGPATSPPSGSATVAKDGPITAAKTDAAATYGFLFCKCTITGAANNVTQLGRPWDAEARVLYRESSLSATIKTAQPWTGMSGNTWQNARFREYRNTGSGAGANSNRPQLTDSQAATYTPQRYLAGSDAWNPVG